MAEARARALAAHEQAERSARERVADAEMRARAMAEPAAMARAATATAPSANTPAHDEARAGRTAAAATDIATDPTPEQAAVALPAETDEVDALLDRLRVGNIAFNAPQTINISETIRVRALVSPDAAAATLQAQVAAPGEQVVAPLKISKLMEARLTGDGFRIVPITAAQQAVGSGVTTWEWEVTPETAGRHRLTLTVDAFVRMDGQSVAKTLRTFDHPIEVQVTAGQRIGGWLEEHGKWAWSTLLVPLWAWWSRRRKAKPDSRET
jgi:hypothetical protein